MDFTKSVLIILVVAAVNFFTRVVPFLFFPTPEKTPKFIFYLGKALPPAVMGMLVIYCLKNVSAISFPFGLPEIIAIISVVLLHAKFKNNLISIFGGTALYMFLIQAVFVL